MPPLETMTSTVRPSSFSAAEIASTLPPSLQITLRLLARSIEGAPAPSPFRSCRAVVLSSWALNSTSTPSGRFAGSSSDPSGPSRSTAIAETTGWPAAKTGSPLGRSTRLSAEWLRKVIQTERNGLDTCVSLEILANDSAARRVSFWRRMPHSISFEYKSPAFARASTVVVISNSPNALNGFVFNGARVTTESSPSAPMSSFDLFPSIFTSDSPVVHVSVVCSCIRASVAMLHPNRRA